LKKLIVQFTLFFGIIFSLHSQTGTLRGNVYDTETGEPVLYCTIQLAGTTIGTTTDFDGFFTITNIPEGTYRLVVTYIGFDSLSQEVVIGANKIVYERLNLTANSVQLSTVDISAQKEKARSEVQISTLTLTCLYRRSRWAIVY